MKRATAFLFFAMISFSGFCLSLGLNTKAPFELRISINSSNPAHESKADKITAEVGSSLVLRIQKTNISESDIAKKPQKDGLYGYSINVYDSGGNLVATRAPKQTHMKSGGPAPILGTKDMQLSVGESKVDYVPLTTYYDLSSPGTYTVQVSQRVSDDPHSQTVGSNKLTIEIIPKH